MTEMSPSVDGAPPDRLDRLAVTGIECFAHHGVFADERRDGQRFVVDLVLGLDTRPAAATDDLTRTVHYGELTLAVKEAVERDPVDLLETLAERIVSVCLLAQRVEWCTVTVHKPAAPIGVAVTDVTLTITRPSPRNGRTQTPEREGRSD